MFSESAICLAPDGRSPGSRRWSGIYRGAQLSNSSGRQARLLLVGRKTRRRMPPALRARVAGAVAGTGRYVAAWSTTAPLGELPGASSARREMHTSGAFLCGQTLRFTKQVLVGAAMPPITRGLSRARKKRIGVALRRDARCRRFALRQRFKAAVDVVAGAAVALQANREIWIVSLSPRRHGCRNHSDYENR
jgi:hypothetical protein